MNMDFTFPATLTTTPEPPAVVVAGPLWPAAASSSPPPCSCRSPPSPPTAAAAAAAPPVTTRSRGAPATAMAAAQQQGRPPGAGGDAPAEVEDRMDVLWEDFNEAELPRDPWSESKSESSDAELSEPAARGCAPVLRPSSRVRHCRRRAGTWVLLMRIFRRLFVIDKTVSARRHHAAATTTTRAS